MFFQSIRNIALLLLLAVSVNTLAAEEPTLTIGLIGDSTVANTYGWGPAFAERFGDQTKVLNFAKNGATLDSLSKKLTELLANKPDFVLVQFGHNDQKRYDAEAYSEKLTAYIKRIKQAGGQPVILSSVTRRILGEDGKIKPREAGLHGNLASFAKAAKIVAKTQQVPFIDLYSISVAHHNKIGPEATAAYNFNGDDRTHFSKAGAAGTVDLILPELKTVAPEAVRDLKP